MQEGSLTSLGRQDNAVLRHLPMDVYDRKGSNGRTMPQGCVQTWTRRRVRVHEFRGRVANPALRAPPGTWSTHFKAPCSCTPGRFTSYVSTYTCLDRHVIVYDVRQRAETGRWVMILANLCLAEHIADTNGGSYAPGGNCLRCNLIAFSASWSRSMCKFQQFPFEITRSQGVPLS